MTVDQFIESHPEHPLSDLLRGMYMPGSENFQTTKYAAQGMIILLSYQKTFPEEDLQELMADVKAWIATKPKQPPSNMIN